MSNSQDSTSWKIPDQFGRCPQEAGTEFSLSLGAGMAPFGLHVILHHYHHLLPVVPFSPISEA